MAMMFPVPANEEARLAAVRSLRIGACEVVRGLESIVRLAADAAEAPIALVSLLEETEQHLVANFGLPHVSKTSRQVSFCTHAIMSDGLCVVPDALEDARFRHNPLVQGEPYIRSYAGSVLEPYDGARVGTLCVLDKKPREFSKEVLDRLSELSKAATTILQGHRDRVELERQAKTDPMTGLLNAGGFREAVDSHLRQGTEISFAILDVDFLKRANDRFGHPFGDSYLKTISEVLRRKCGAAVIGRTGGDEFSIVFPTAKAEGPAAMIADARRCLRERMRDLGMPMLGSISAGLCVASEIDEEGDAPSFESLYKAADIALYKSKADGRDRTVVFVAEMNTRQNQRALRLAFGHAAREGRIVPFYQPKIDLATRSVAGFEALVRWRDLDRGLLTPADFRCLLDDRHVSPEITQLVIDGVIEARQAWQAQGIAMPKVAVNITHHDLYDPDFLKTTERRLNEAGFDLADIDFEVTEEAILNLDDAEARHTLEAIRERGGEIALDDFGTGHATLIHLRDWPIDVVKIDGSFVRDLTTNRRNEVIVSSMITIANKLGLKSVAEGVETEEIATALLELGCHQAQGYLFSKPVDSREALNQFSRNSFRPEMRLE